MEKFVLMEKSSHPGSGGRFPILLCRIQTINSLPAAWKKNFPLECRKIAKKKLDAVLNALELSDYRERHPASLSGGQKQRVTIGVAIVKDSPVIYFDEPTSALDPELTGEVLSVMRQLAEEGMTMLVVTHEMGFARNVSSKTVFMENGVVVEQAPSREFFADPKEKRTRAFLQKIAHTE